MQNAWVEFPEATWTENTSSGCFDIADPGFADVRDAEHGKSEIILVKIIKTAEIQLPHYRPFKDIEGSWQPPITRSPDHPRSPDLLFSVPPWWILLFPSIDAL
jgi:hypothetical protein